MARGHILVGVVAGVFVSPLVGMPMAVVEVLRRAREEGEPWL